MIRVMLIDSKGRVELGEFDAGAVTSILEIAKEVGGHRVLEDGSTLELPFHYAGFNLGTGVFEIHFDEE